MISPRVAKAPIPGHPQLVQDGLTGTQRRYYSYYRLMALKQSLQYTGLSPRGRKGTCVSMPHWAQTAGCISRCPPPYPPPPPPPPPPPYPPCWLRRAPRQDGQRLGSLVNPLEAKNSCSPTVKTKPTPQSLHVRSLSEIAIRMSSIYVGLVQSRSSDVTETLTCTIADSTR